MLRQLSTNEVDGEEKEGKVMHEAIPIFKALSCTRGSGLPRPRLNLPQEW
eukprot:gene12902-8762_t